MRTQRLMTVMLGALALQLLSGASAHAGCGCDKPPPPLAAIRPAFASPGKTVTLFAPDIKRGRRYNVTFGSGDGAITISARAKSQRDFADGIVKPQLIVTVPSLPLGPTDVTVTRRDVTILSVPATDFTALQAPLDLPEMAAHTIAECYSAAVGADGTVYFPVDVSAIALRTVFDGFGLGYPLAFAGSDIAIYNTQGVLMQLLTPSNAAIWAITDDDVSDDSFTLTYDRHEFQTYREQHLHLNGWGLDARDPNWHVDGTRHIDHEHLIVAIHGRLKGEVTAPPAGATPPFDLSVTTVLADLPALAPVESVLQWATCGLLNGLPGVPPIVPTIAPIAPTATPPLATPSPALPLPTPTPLLPLPLPTLSLPSLV